MISANALFKPFRGVVRPTQRALFRRDTIYASAFLLSSSAASELDDHSTWQQMNSKCRSLAKLLLDDDDLQTGQRNLSDADRLRERHIFDRRRGLSQAITMIESRKPEHQQQSNLLLSYLLGHDNNHKRKESSFRLGIAGPPGAGKSTFVEAFGKYLLNILPTTSAKSESRGLCNKLAVVCVDPSSAVTGGSILGDKTRMMELSMHEKAYVRPSPTRNVLGGLSAYTDDVVSLCQIAGYDFVMIETVGLGQSEIEVKESVDMLMLMVPPGGGDDLQGMKKGIMEVADMVVVTKADGHFLQAAKHTAADYRGALRMTSRMAGSDNIAAGWECPPVLLCSSNTGEGLEKVWDEICRFRGLMVESGLLQRKRQQQTHYWMWKNLQNLILAQTKTNTVLRKKAQALERDLVDGKTTPRLAATELLECLVRS